MKLISARASLAPAPVSTTNRAPALGQQIGQLLERWVGIHPTPAKAVAHRRQIVSDESRIEHAPSPTILYSRRNARPVLSGGAARSSRGVPIRVARHQFCYD